VKIALEIKKSAKEIVLNTNQLKIHSAELSTEHTKTETSAKASNISYDTNAQRATISFDQEFPVASKAWLDIKFQGTMNNVCLSNWESSALKLTGSSSCQVSIDLNTSQRLRRPSLFHEMMSIIIC
jgi:hypothetical protein